MAATTEPIDSASLASSQGPRLVVAAFYKDPTTGATYVHKDLEETQEAWAEESHLGPPAADERFGDVESWAAYVQTFSTTERPPFLTWSAAGLRAVLDYHTPGDEGTGYRRWSATHPFERSREWLQWLGFANGQAVGQRHAIEKLEDMAPDIVDPKPTELMEILRALRTSVAAKANTELQEDGSTHVSFTRDAAVKSGKDGEVGLPPEFTIAIPALKGHVDEAGKPVVYRLAVKVRASVDDNAHLTLRFSIPLAERTLEDAFLDRVSAAKTLLGDQFLVLRAAG